MGLQHDNCSVAQRGPETREETREKRRPDTPKTAPAVPKETHTNTAARYGRYGAPSLPDANTPPDLTPGQIARLADDR